jgi:hypothetical protein
MNPRFIDGGLRPLIRYFEFLYINNAVMKDLLAQKLGPSWSTELAYKLSEQGPSSPIFSRLYAALDSEEELYAAIQEFLRIKTDITGENADVTQ